ncbi:MAG TPA: YraN family protein [Paraburkholderia sp.]|nr:YraN family protein [Paraburkholderia sp.]
METSPTLCHAPRGGPAARRTTKAVGERFEALALAYLQRRCLRLVARNVRCRRGELDLVMREPDGTLVFVEVRARTRRGYDGAAASVGWRKRGRLVAAARYFLAQCASRSNDMPACRFDVVAFDGGRIVWLRDAFRADDG